MDFVEIWNDCYSLLATEGYCAMWRYLDGRVDNGDLHMADADCLADEVVSVYTQNR